MKQAAIDKAPYSEIQGIELIGKKRKGKIKKNY